jgi:YegS/Rv2252/BmrU family lipid kinase
MKNLMILNPVSCTGRALKLKPRIEEILDRLGIDYMLHISRSSEDIINTIRKNLNDFSNFISVGGDGTLHHIANAIAKTDKNLGSIPLGSGNDIACSLGFSADIENACKAIKRCITRKIDLGLINSRYYYMGVSGTGFDSVVTDLANNTRFPVKGPVKYKYAVYRTLITFTSKRFYIKYNSKEKTVYGMMLAIGNTDMYGGGMKITPQANPFDGILDTCILKRMSKIHFIKTFPQVFEGKHIYDSFVEYFKVNSMEVDSDYNFSVFADGEYICKLPVRYEVVPKALNVIVNEPSHRSSL